MECFFQNCNPGTCRNLYLPARSQFRARKCSNGPMLTKFMILPCSPASWSIRLDRMMEWPFDDSVTVRCQYFARLEQDSLEGYMCLKLTSNSSTCQNSQVHKSRGRNGSVTIYYYTYWPNSIISVSYSHDLKFCWPWGPCTMEGTLPSGDTTMTPLNWKLRLPSSHFGLLIHLNQ